MSLPHARHGFASVRPYVHGPLAVQLPLRLTWHGAPASARRTHPPPTASPDRPLRQSLSVVDPEGRPHRIGRQRSAWSSSGSMTARIESGAQ